MWLDRVHTTSGNNLKGLWAHPQTPFRVIKAVNPYRDAFFDYACFLLRKKPANPYFPRVFDIWLENDLAYIEIERLRVLTSEERDDLWDFARDSNDYITSRSERHDDIVYFAPHAYLCALRLIRRHFIDRLDHWADLHIDNLMVRPSTNELVLNDPIWN